MAINLPNFLGASPQEADFSGVRDALPNFLRGYTSHLVAPRAEEEQRKLELANALAEIQNRYEEPKLQGDIKHQDLVNQYYGDLIEAQIAHYKAQAEHQKAGGSKQGHARNVEDLNKLLNDPNIPDEMKALAKQLFEMDLAKSGSLVDTRNSNLLWKGWSQLNKDDQAKVSGQYTALGIGPQDAQELWNHKITPELIHGYKQQNPNATIHQTVEALAKQIHGDFVPAGQQQAIQESQEAQQMPQGQPEDAQIQSPGQAQLPVQPVDVRTVPIQPAMTSSNRTDYNNLQANRAEADYLGNWVTEHNAPYSQFPMKEVWDSFANRKDAATQQKRWEYLAAQMMGPDAALLNIRLAGGSTARDAIHDLEQRMKLEAKGNCLHITPEDYLQATRIMHKVLDKGAEIRGNAMAGQLPSVPNNFQTTIQNAQENKSTVQRTYKGKTYNIPEHLIKKFDEEHK